jgi:hypothetical protein
MDYFKAGFISSILILSIYGAEAQSFRQSIQDDRKKMLLDQVKPPKTNLSAPLPSKQNSDIPTDRKKYLGMPGGLTGGAMFEDKYTISPHVSSFDIKQLVKPKFGEETKVMLVNGKFTIVPVKEYEHILDKLSQKHRLQGIMISTGFGGLNLSGYNKKKLSEKSKTILKTVFGMEVEDDD